MKIVLNINIRSLLIFDRNLVGGDEVVRSSSFSACSHGGRGCRSAVLRGDHHCDVVWWSMWPELGGAARDVVDVAAVDVVGARRSCSGRGRGRRGRSSTKLLGTWSTWSRSELGGAARDVVGDSDSSRSAMV